METVHFPTEEEIDLMLSELENSKNVLPKEVLSFFTQTQTIFDCINSGKNSLAYLYDNDGTLSDENVSNTFAYIILKTLRFWQSINYELYLGSMTEEQARINFLRHNVKSYILNIEQNNFHGFDKTWKERLSKPTINFFIKVVSGLNLYNDNFNFKPRI